MADENVYRPVLHFRLAHGNIKYMYFHIDYQVSAT